MTIHFPGGTKMAALPYARASRAPSIFGSTSTPQARGPTGFFFFFARRQGINQLDDTKKKTNPVLGPNQHRKPRNITETGTRFLSRADPVAHLVRVGVSWNTADSSRVSGLIARQLYSIPLEYQILQEGDGGFQPAWIRRPVEASIDFGGGKCW